MTQPLLLTYVHQGRERTLSFDGVARSILWVCPGSSESQRDAVASVEQHGNRVMLRPATAFQLVVEDGSQAPEVALDDAAERFVRLVSVHDGSVSSLLVRPASERARVFRKYGFSCDVELLVGRDESAQLSYRSRFVSSRHAAIRLVGEQFTVEDLGSSNGTFVNGVLLQPGAQLSLTPGDVVSVMDLVVMVGHRFVCMNDPDGLTLGQVAGMTPIDHAAFKAMCPPASETSGAIEPFYPAPRLMHTIHAREFKVDDPPQKKKQDEQPAIMQLGPQFLMGFASVFMGMNAITGLADGSSDILTALPSIAMCVSMLGGMMVFPVIINSYQKKIDARDELKRESAYTDYLNGIESTLVDECEVQAQILRDNRTPMGDLLNDVWQLAPQLMNRTLVHDDFMDLRVGTGSISLDADVHWPEKRFTIDDDKLMDKVEALRKNPPAVNDVPLAFNPAKHYVAGIVGPRPDVWAFARGLVTQVCGMFGYQEVKVALVASEDEEPEWAFLRAMPHLFDDAGQRRFIATDFDSLIEVGMGLERVVEQRKGEKKASFSVSDTDFAGYGTYYVVICADKGLCERSDTLSRLARERKNYGMSLIYFGEELKDLPRECDYVIDLSANDGLALLGGSSSLSRGTGAPAKTGADSGSACMFDRNDVSGTLVRFEPDIMIDRVTANAVGHSLARLKLDLASQHSQIPKSLGFLQMFEVGNTTQLNIAQRWQENDASRSLATPVGRDAQGEFSILNLHENVHGPHGLIAGTTGSGKSEFIITYILSMCVNFAPDEASFVLIDYKGGGLAGAFDNERFVLPHLAGTITNLDGAAITRSLVSIKSELKRRQDMFNKARDITGEATVDIYKYLAYYRQGVLTEPLPHLFIVADEFAELKQQEPEFMEELISAARIGRSLGVHLILATQKPSGVVNDQIWSNSRFKVCLKVADAADSKEMIRRPDAAEIKGPGRFYMLVGFNEFFACGQSAYSGSKYAPMDSYEPPRDNSVDLIDDLGNNVASLKPTVQATKTKESELNAVLSAICQTADTVGKHAGRLWLNPLPDRIVLGSLEGRYRYEAPTDGLQVVVGEMDDPENQRQDLYALDLAECGNVMLYGGQGSGVEALAATMLYGLSGDYGPDKLSYYVIDFGAGTLTAFRDMPQCGGVVLTGDDERMNNLMKLLEGEVHRRRQLFSTAGGDIDLYNRQCAPSERVTRTVVVLVNLASFYEQYENTLEDRLTALTRDAPRYGITFIMTSATANTPRMRLRSTFSVSVATSFNDPDDYSSLLGNLKGVVPPHQDKRGLIKIKKAVYEFQGASITESVETERDAVEALAADLASHAATRARQIPVLPDRVRLQDMGPSATRSALVPVGFSKASVEPLSFDLAKTPYMLVYGNDNDSIAMYLRGMHECMEAAGNGGSLTYCFIDPDKIMGPVEDKNVIQTKAGSAAALDRIEHGERPCDVLVLTSYVQLMSGLESADLTALNDYIANEEGIGHTKIVACTEAWRTRGIYDDYYTVLTAYGSGVWVGGGFEDQSVFRFSRIENEYRLPARRSDGFCCNRGTIQSVRLVEAADEPDDEEA